MIRLRLDYQRSIKPFPLVGAVLLAGSIAISVMAVDYYQGLADRISETEASLSVFAKASSVHVNDSYSERGGVIRDIKQANDVLRQLTLPWENLFQALESSTDPEVTFLGMAPDVEKHVVDINCEAKNISAMLSFIKRLKERQEFSSVYLQSHQIQESDPQRPVRFSLIAVWRDDA